ncbi:Na+/H+ antiporter subunit D [Siminovitchia sp. FSL H7-0308]|uniref:Multicomponent Na+:H+ antiporter subunit D n=1 Tax=Siminovitchia thermophila TaxID=1245522 RepID=A0ABS2R2Y2_9BACI|nr:Na+/H+ antiporter subunit D [Siminovitchia thermophila]MBM7714011.1 multicomponent Na+:H+ antiporter subunit D [Siminovitchia thermophila]ONK23888.1 Na+/H+ antiporter subunit D [Bacillus sp. VT-16-64]
MSNLLILPIIIPLLTAVFLIFFKKYILVQRWISVISVTATLVTSIILVEKVKNDGIQTLDVGSWPAPFGITLVSDMLSALLVTATSLIALCCIIYSFRSIGEGRERNYYYPVVQFLIVGVNGAFTTGDIFNMFVFFEVMLMSSYVLLVIGGTKIQLRETIKYILVNITSSALFVISVAYLYSVVGTLNMAHISERIAEVNQPAILTVLAVLFLIVFGLKGAIFPLFFWLPGSYYAPPAAIMALFGALLTKVGVYSILRTYTLFFYHDTGFTHELLMILSLLTIVLGSIAAVAYKDMKKIVIYNIIIAIGVITYGIGAMNTDALTGSVFYLIHDMVIKAVLFLLVGLIISITGANSYDKFSGLIKHYPLLGWLFFISVLALAGIPPLSGFIGKILIVNGAFSNGDLVGGLIILISSLFVLYSLMRVFINGFWGDPEGSKKKESIRMGTYLFPVIILVGTAVAYGVFSEYVHMYVSQAVEVIENPEMYIEAVLQK